MLLPLNLVFAAAFLVFYLVYSFLPLPLPYFDFMVGISGVGALLFASSALLQVTIQKKKKFLQRVAWVGVASSVFWLTFLVYSFAKMTPL